LTKILTKELGYCERVSVIFSVQNLADYFDLFFRRRARISARHVVNNRSCCNPGLPDGIFSDQKIAISVNFGDALQWNMLVYFMDIWSISYPFDIIYGHLVHFVGHLV
jgi:hypothetical protein